MKKIIVVLLIGAVFFSCDSAKKALQRGSYEQACFMAIKKLQKKTSDEEHAEIFTIAYQKANQKDLDRVDYLKQSGEQTSWDEIYKLYKKLEKKTRISRDCITIKSWR
ncbi:MAG: hypothetical protein HC831_15005 [Chloroflexia bacterium]|nr:hypothetical protein [Chloroflexia bacterium]